MGMGLLVGLLAACGNQAANDPDEGDLPERALPIQAITVRLHDLSRSVEVSAPVEPYRIIRLASRTDGVLTEVGVEAGDRIAAGAVLAQIDVREQRAELARAQARLNERQANFERVQQLKDSQYIDAASFETARAELDIARTEVQLWQTRVDFGRVVSTIDGTVVERYVEPGEAIGRHAPLFSIADLSSLVVRPGISELDVRGLTVGDSGGRDVRCDRPGTTRGGGDSSYLSGGRARKPPDYGGDRTARRRHRRRAPRIPGSGAVAG